MISDSLIPNHQEDATDPKSRHKGKFESEAYLAEIGMPYTSIRPTYIYGALNYNPLEQYFFERLDQDKTVIVPGEKESGTVPWNCPWRLGRGARCGAWSRLQFATAGYLCSTT